MYLIQFPGDEEDEGGMVEDEEGEGSLSVEGEETANIKEEVRETGFLKGGGVGGESGTASLHCSAASYRMKTNVDRKRELIQRDREFCLCSGIKSLQRCGGYREGY